MSGHTKGPWTPFILDKPLSDIPAYVQQCISASPGADFFFVGADHPDGGSVDVCHVGNGPKREANARLIAEAGTVATETGLTPRQLAEQRAELIAALERAEQFIRNGIEYGFIRMPDSDTPDTAHATLPQIQAAIAKARGAA